MAENNEKVEQLIKKVEALSKWQENFSKELNNIRSELHSIVSNEAKTSNIIEEPADSNLNISETEKRNEKTNYSYQNIPPKPAYNTYYKKPYQVPPKSDVPSKAKANIEKFIGENLINKIGIIITIIGVAIGTKYAIDHEMISPMTRIILGYLVGLGLLGFAIKLKPNYESFSAVLLSGAMAIMYFISYFAYSFYGLIPQTVTFILMLLFTCFTVFSAIKYDKQVIAHIGLVGAYAVPFLLSDNSGKVAILFSYIALINIGILVISFRKYWKPLYYTTFVLTWLIFTSWYVFDYKTDSHFGLALTFLSIFFTIFYATFLSYKLIKNEKYILSDILLLLINSFIFYGFSYSIFSNHNTGEYFLGLLTLVNAVIHFAVSVIIYKQKAVDRNLFYIVIGLVLVFITIAIPVQLEGNWVTLLWAGEAALLFWIGRTKSISFYENLSFPLIMLSFISLIQDWSDFYFHYFTSVPDEKIFPIFNIVFLSSIIVAVSFAFITWLNRNEKYQSSLTSNKELFNTFSVMISGVFFFILYYSMFLEIANYWNQQFIDSYKTFTTAGKNYAEYHRDYNLIFYKDLWLINYSLLFMTVVSIFNIKKLKNSFLANINLGLNTFAIAVFLLYGIYLLGNLRDNYLHNTLANVYHRGIFDFVVRYISFAIVGGLIFVCYKYIQQEFVKVKFNITFDIIMYIAILLIASSELITWLNVAGSEQSYKLGLSIFWGVYSLLLIALGIWKKKQHLRIGAIVLFSITLIKLFFNDVPELETISKTILFVSLGILLLIISFLYNKYKNIINDEN